MLTSFLFAAAFTSLAIPLIPSPRLQRFLLTWFGRGLRLALLGGLALGALHTFEPQWAGSFLVTPADLIPDRFQFTQPDTADRFHWLLGSGLLIGLALPLLALMDFARNRAAETAVFQRLLGELADSGRLIARHLDGESPAEPRLSSNRRQEMRSALEAIQNVTQQAAASAPCRRTLAELIQ